MADDFEDGFASREDTAARKRDTDGEELVAGVAFDVEGDGSGDASNFPD